MPTADELHAAAWRVIEDFARDGVPYVLYLRAFGWEAQHGPDDARRELLETHLVDRAARIGANVLTIQSPGGSVLLRRAPALALPDDEWQRYTRNLISDADLVVSEALTLSPGVRTELAYAFETGAIERIALLVHATGCVFTS